MATSTLVQFLAEGSGTDTSARRQVQTFIAAEAIAANDAVSLDLAQAIDGDKALKVMKADTGTATDKCFDSRPSCLGAVGLLPYRPPHLLTGNG